MREGNHAFIRKSLSVFNGRNSHAQELKSKFDGNNGSRPKERGAALITVLILMSILMAISITVLAVVTHETRIAGSDLQRTQTFYAAAASVEKMTSDFCDLLRELRGPQQLN